MGVYSQLFVFFVKAILKFPSLSFSFSPVTFLIRFLKDDNTQLYILHFMKLFFVLVVDMFTFQRTIQTANKKATFETQNLFDNVRITASRSKTMIGMDQSTLSGEFLRVYPCGPYTLKRVNGFNSDIREVCGDGPNIYGFDLIYVLAEWPIITNSKANQAQIRDHIQKAYKRGAVSTIHWHINNPINDDYYFKPPREIWQAVPEEHCKEPPLKGLENCGKVFHKVEKKFKFVVEWFNTLEDEHGTPIPIIFRPLHEQNGDWFWWGGGKSSDGSGPDFNVWQTSYRALYRWMVEYHNKHGRNNLLWVTAPNGGTSLTRESYLNYSADPELIDVFGYDFYGEFSQKKILEEIRMVVELAEEMKKIPAVTEQGYNDGTRSHWPADIWTSHVLGPVLDDYGAANRIGWILMWYNRRDEESCDRQYWGPHKGHRNAVDFLKLCSREDIVMEGHYKYYDRPAELYVPPPADDDLGICKQRSNDICTGNNGRGYGNVEKCGRDGHLCAAVNTISNCKCKIAPAPKAPNGYPYCLSRNGCGYGDLWKCDGDETCAKTDDTFTYVCVSYCPEVNKPETCPSVPRTCTSNDGRGSGLIVSCHGMMLCSKEDDCDCQIGRTPIASNGIPYCIANKGCGYGTAWECDPGIQCAKSDETYNTTCVSYCPVNPIDSMCPTLLQLCKEHYGRGNGKVFPCADSLHCARDNVDCPCKIAGKPTAENGLEYCLSNNGCGFGAAFSCGSGLSCTKSDTSYEVSCVSQC